MALLYAGLDGTQAGEVVTALDQRGVVYEVRGDAIYVDGRAARRAAHDTRGARACLRTVASGYELLDALSGFGTTSQMFDAAYLARQGGRTGAHHRGQPADPLGARAYRQRRQRSRFAAICMPTRLGHCRDRRAGGLVASAGQGIEISGRLGSLRNDARGCFGHRRRRRADRVGRRSGAAPGGDSRAEELRHNVERLLEARVGYGNAVVEVAVETVTEREAITERRFDPDSARGDFDRNAGTQQSSSDDRGQGAVTVASNLPAGDAAGSDGTVAKPARARPGSGPTSKSRKRRARCCAAPARSGG